jgi:hypothetical protein
MCIGMIPALRREGRGGGGDECPSKGRAHEKGSVRPERRRWCIEVGGRLGPEGFLGEGIIFLYREE